MSIFIEPAFTPYYKSHPLTLIDIGAAQGISDHLKRAEKYMQLYGFEPHRESYEALQAQRRPNERYFNTALSDNDGEATFHVTRKSTASSFYKPNLALRAPFQAPDDLEIVKTLKIKTERLDDLGKANKIESIDLIKLDTQGSELLILKGAERYLRDSIFGIEIEVEFAPAYIDQPLYADVDAYLRKMGFNLFNLGLVRWQRLSSRQKQTKGQLISADALYLKDSVKVKENVDSLGSNEKKKAQLAKAVSICLLYGHPDYALDLLDLVPGLFSDQELREGKKFILNRMADRLNLPDIRGRWWLARQLYRIWSVVEPTFNRWNSFDNNLAR